MDEALKKAIEKSLEQATKAKDDLRADIIKSLMIDKTPEDCKIEKFFAVKIEEKSVTQNDKGEFIIESIIASDSSIDRYGDTIDQNGWDLKNYKNNPVILWAHDNKGFPIANALETKVVDGKLIQKHIFPAEGINGDADKVRKLIKSGFIHAVSVGFIPKDWTTSEDEHGFIVFNFTKQELLEVSYCSVPANPNALVQSRSFDDLKREVLNSAIEKKEQEEIKEDVKVTEAKDDEEKDLTIDKSGKVISAKNKKIINDALTAITAVGDALKSLLAIDEEESKSNQNIETKAAEDEGSISDEGGEDRTDLDNSEGNEQPEESPENKQIDLINSIRRAARASYQGTELVLTLLKDLKKESE